MIQEEFEKLVKPDLYQVFLLSCPPSMPLSFARHPWFVINTKGTITRYGVKASPQMYGLTNCFGHLCINSLPPWRGLTILRSRPDWYIWPVTLHGVVEGGEESLAKRMAEFIEQTPQTYPYC